MGHDTNEAACCIEMLVPHAPYNEKNKTPDCAFFGLSLGEVAQRLRAINKSCLSVWLWRVKQSNLLARQREEPRVLSDGTDDPQQPCDSQNKIKWVSGARSLPHSDEDKDVLKEKMTRIGGGKQAAELNIR